MNDKDILEEYIAKSNSSQKKADKTGEVKNEIAKYDIISINKKLSFLFFIPFIVHLISLSTYSSYVYGMWDALWIPSNINVIEMESIDHLYLWCAVAFFCSIMTYFIKKEQMIRSKMDDKIHSQVLYHAMPTEEKFTVAVFAVVFVFILALLTCANKFEVYEYTSRILTFSMFVLCLYGSSKWFGKKDDNVESKQKYFDELKETMIEDRNRKHYLKEKILEDPAIMKMVLKEYEKPSFKHHPDYNYYVDLIEGLKERNEQLIERYNEMKKLQKMYQAVYEENIEIEEPVSMTNT